MPLQISQSPQERPEGSGSGQEQRPSVEAEPRRQALAPARAFSLLCEASQYPDAALRFADEGGSARLLGVDNAAERVRDLSELSRLSVRLVDGRRLNDAIVLPVDALPQSLHALLEGAVIQHEGNAVTLFEFVRDHANIEAVVFTRVLSSPVAQLPGSRGDFAAGISIGGATYVPYEQLQQSAADNPLADSFLYPGKRIAFVNFGARTSAGELLATPQRDSVVAARLVHEAEQMRVYAQVVRKERPLEDAAHRRVDQLAYEKEFDALTAINTYLEATGAGNALTRAQVLLNERQRERIQDRLRRLN